MREAKPGDCLKLFLYDSIIRYRVSAGRWAMVFLGPDGYQVVPDSQPTGDAFYSELLGHACYVPEVLEDIERLL